MKSVIAFWAVALTALGGLLFWRNTRMYRQRSAVWRMSKSLTELLVLLLTAAFLPALLIVWLVTWVTRPIENPWVRLFVGVLTGVTFGLLSNIAVEVLVALGVLAIDIKTGTSDRSGFLHCWRRAKHDTEPVAAAG